MKTIQYVPKIINNFYNSHLICLRMQIKSAKKIAKISYDALSLSIVMVDLDFLARNGFLSWCFL